MKKKKHKYYSSTVPELTARWALHACHLLKAAYDEGRRMSGSVSWDDLDAAHEQAIRALRRAKEI